MQQKSHHTNKDSLEYAAILSGLSMVGDDISDDDIKQARNLHRQHHKGSVSFTVASPATSAKRSAL